MGCRNLWESCVQLAFWRIDTPRTPAPAPAPPLKQGPFKDGTTTSSNVIDINYRPELDATAKSATKIAFVQVVQILLDGKAVKPTQVDAAWGWKDQIATDDYHYVDVYSKLWPTPDYQQGENTKVNSEGSIGASTTPSKMQDKPFAATIEDGGWYDQAKGSGTKIITFKFETFAWAMEGEDSPKFYQGITWEYSRTVEEHDAQFKEGCAVPGPCQDYRHNKYAIHVIYRGVQEIQPCKP